jgi:ABC-type branched-subunit amino acid transport system permease subunit
MRLEKLFPIFAAAFAVIYLLAVEQNWALFTYHPKLGQFEWFAQPARTGPPMYWYGWLTTSVLGATLACLLSWPLVRHRPIQFWLGWTVPLAVMVIFVPFFRDFFWR